MFEAKQVGTGRGLSFEPDVARAFGEVIRQRRIAANLAQDGFALLARVDRSYYGKLERGERQPALAVILRLARGFGVPASDLIRDVEQLLLKKI